MFLTKQSQPPSPPPAPEPIQEPNNLIEFRFKLSGEALTKLISLALSIALGSAGVWGYLQSQTTSTPLDITSPSAEIAP